MIMRSLFVVVLVVTLNACALHGAQVPEVIDEMPAAFTHPIDGGRLADAGWWNRFGDRALPELVAEARAANHTLAAGRASVRAARAAVQSAGASLFPQATAGLSSSADDERGFDDYTTSGRLSVSWQVDLFGGNRARRDAALARYDARQFEQQALGLSVETETAFVYFSVLALRERLQVAEANLQISQRVYDIVQVRHRAGAVTRFDVAIQEAAVANARARVTSLRADLVNLESALAVLLGLAPQQFEAPAGRLMGVEVPILETGPPAALLERRPDLRRAEAEIVASGADVAAAKAALLPSLDLAAVWNRADLGSGNTVGSLIASLSAPLFSGGSLAGQREQASAREAQAIAEYRQAILDALREVEVSLSALGSAGVREEQLGIARAAAEQALAVAEVRYRSGADDLTSLLSAQSTLFDASDAVVQARLDRLSAVLDLYLALGGSA